MNRWPAETRLQALSLIHQGVPYARIQAELSVPKSTLSVWFSHTGQVRDPRKQLRHLIAARKIAVRVLNRKKLERIKEAETRAKQSSLQIRADDVNAAKGLLAMLYWAEGGKREGNMKFTNTDSELVLLFLSLLRKAFEIDESRLRVGLQIHDYHDSKRTVAFWSKKLSIPKSQFWKPYLKPRGNGKKYRENFAGICNLHYASSAIQRELMALGHEIARSLL